MFRDPIELYRVICGLWSAKTASPPQSWSPENPARNHCSVTALVVQDVFGGDILKTRTAGGTHFYNSIGGQRWDLTMSQFQEPIPFDDTPSSRDEALADCGVTKYGELAGRLTAWRGARQID
jgi:hypothetical protein